MFARKYWLPAAFCLAVATATTIAWAISFQLGQTKEELKLDYDVKVTDHGTGRVTVVFTLRDEGRLKPLYATSLVMQGQEKNDDGGHWMDLDVPIALRTEDKAQVARVHLRKEWAERAEIWLRTSSLDGKPVGNGGYYYVIPLEKYVKDAQPVKK